MARVELYWTDYFHLSTCTPPHRVHRVVTFNPDPLFQGNYLFGGPVQHWRMVLGVRVFSPHTPVRLDCRLARKTQCVVPLTHVFVSKRRPRRRRLQLCWDAPTSATRN